MKEIDLAVPFYSNTADGTHCFQAALRMVFEYFQPKKKISWKQWDRITAKIKNKYTWPMAGLIWMQEEGFEVVNIEGFNYEEFAKLGDKYLINELTKEVAQDQIRNSNIDQERRYSREFLKKVKTEKRLPTVWDIKKLVQGGYVLVCNVNAYALSQMKGYSGHFIVIKGLKKGGLIIHDPGLPARKNLFVKTEVFQKAWAYPSRKSKNIMAFRKKTINNKDSLV